MKQTYIRDGSVESRAKLARLIASDIMELKVSGKTKDAIPSIFASSIVYTVVNELAEGNHTKPEIADMVEDFLTAYTIILTHTYGSN